MALILNAVIQFFYRTLWLMMQYYQTRDTRAYDAVLSNQVWLQTDQQFRRYIRNYILTIYKPLQWLWHWTQWTNISAWHSGLWCCITILGLVTKCPAVQKVLSRQTFTNILNLHCDLDLERSNPIFPQDTPAYDVVLSYQVWLQMDQKFRRYNRNSHILII